MPSSQPRHTPLRSAMAVARASRDPIVAAGCWRLQRLSQRSFNGWATRHQTRWWEYPWVVQQVRRNLAGRARKAADFGAGRSPIPIALQRLGLETTVVDPDSQKQMGKQVGGEWDWTDYGQWGVKTVESGIEDATVFDVGELGFAVSVSVIEHVPATMRRTGIQNIAKFLEPGGVAVLTVDLVRGTDSLWNRILGKEVEPIDVHGDLDALIAECADAGLHLEQSRRGPLSDRRVDVHGLALRKR